MNKYLYIEYSNAESIMPYYVAEETGKIYLDADVGESVMDYVEEGEEDGEMNFYPSWQRGTKRYVLRTDLEPQHRVALFHRLVKMDNVKMILRNTAVVYPKRIIVSHSYPFDDKKYALVVIEFDLQETLVKPICPDILVVTS